MLIGLLAVRYDRVWDLTVNQRNQLSEQSIAIVKKLQSPLYITVFTRGNPKVKALVNRLLRRYQTHADIHWTFKHPDAEIDVVRQYGITRDGELLLTYQNKTLLVDTLNETAITRGVYLSLVGRVRHVAFATGQGEIGFGAGDNGFSQLKQRLTQEAIQVSQLDLAVTKRVPDNTDVLVLAAPKFVYGAVEVNAIRDYVDNGGRVLWLASQAPSSQQPALSRLIGVRFSGGTLMGQTGKDYGLKDSTYVPIIPNPNKPSIALSGIETLLVLPAVSPIVSLPTEQANAWQIAPLLQATGQWFLRKQNNLSTASAPVMVGASLTPSEPSKHGKWWLIGDADFATDRFIGQGQNGDFAVNTLRYLAAPDVGHIQIDRVMPAPVVMSKNTLAYLALGLMLGIPALILCMGFYLRRWLTS